MVNLMLMIKDLKEFQGLINYVIINNSNIRIYNISTNINESVEYFKENYSNIDIILTDYTFLEVQCFKDILNDYLKIDISNFMIIFSNSKNINKNSTNKLFIENNYNNILNKIDKINIQKNDILLAKTKKIISNYLKQLGYNSSHFGTTYLNETIIFLIINNYKKCPNLSKNVYPNIAEKFFTHSHNIKCDITLATKYMNSKNTLSEKEKFNIFKVDGYIYSKSVINYILKKQPLYPHRYNG